MANSPTTLTRLQARQVDQIAIDRFGIPGIVLMENAGRGAADMLCARGIHGRVVICCGKGNNAGDGFVIARHLELRGHAVEVLAWAAENELAGDALTNYRILKQTSVPIHHHPRDVRRCVSGADWIVEALLGTGSRGEPRPPLDSVIDCLNQAEARRLAIDLPAGLDCDTGQPARHTFRADHTVTFVAPKRGLIAPVAGPFVGQIHVADIGAPRAVLEAVDVTG